MKKFFTGVVLLAVLLAAVRVLACAVPVFRYALERWPADPYRITVFNRGALPAAQKTLVDTVRTNSEDYLINADINLVDIEGKPASTDVELWKAQTNAELPWVVVRYPAASRIEQVVVQGNLDAKFMQQILDSPVRREICKRILQGESVVWVMLESGDKKQDDETVELLKKTSAELEQVLEIPPVDPDDPRSDVNVTLRIAFSTIRLSRSDPAEKSLVAQLVNIHQQIADAKGPVVFPVFGRGRVLCALAGEELTSANLEEVAVFLTGACSCEAKAMNPGVDLLIAADWDGLLEGQAVRDPEMPPLVSLSQLAAEARPVEEAGETAVPRPRTSVLTRNLSIVIGLGIVAVIAGAVLLRNRGKKQ